MAISRTMDALLAALCAAAVLALVSIKGDALYVGLWYYLLVPLVILGLSARLKPQPLFLLGASIALSITFVFYLRINWQASRPEGLLGLGHLFSLPGALIGSLIVARAMKYSSSVSCLSSGFMGFGSLGLGYFANQLLVCNTVFWCGPLSLPLKSYSIRRSGVGIAIVLRPTLECARAPFAMVSKRTLILTTMRNGHG